MISKKSVSLVSPSLSCNTNKLRHQTIRNRSRTWCFTWNNYTEEEFVSLSHPDFFKMEIIKLIFQEEIGKENTKHLQGFVQFKNQIDFRRIKSLLPKCHIEECRSVKASIKYCSKEDSRCGKTYRFGIEDYELSKSKIPPLSDEEIINNLKENAWEDYDKDEDHFWAKNLMDF